MSFFNKKEDVISIELTPHGRKLLSKGKLKPSFYCFFDDDILYDSQRGGFTENNSQTKNRILSETPYLKPQTNYKGVESRYADQRSYETENHLMNPIGSNKIEREKTNGWDVTFLHNTASSGVNYLSKTDSPTIQIPQIESTISFQLKVGNGVNEQATESIELNYLNPAMTNNNFINVIEEQVLLNLLETNGFYENDGLEIEVFLYEQDEQSYKRLNKFKKESPIQDDLLITENKNSQKALFEVRETTQDSDLMEFWLRIKVDDEISLSDICSGVKNLEKNNIYLDGDYECPDRVSSIGDIYSTSVSDLEDCGE